MAMPRRSHVPLLLAVLLGVALAAYTFAPRTGTGAVVLEGEEADAEQEGDEAEEGDEGEEEAKTLSHPHSGTRWIRPGANVYQKSEDDTANPGYDIPQMQHIGSINPYTDMPYTSQRGLGLIPSRYHKSFGYPRYTPKGQKPVFSPHTAQSDLDIMKDYGLVSDTKFKVRPPALPTHSPPIGRGPHPLATTLYCTPPPTDRAPMLPSSSHPSRGRCGRRRSRVPTATPSTRWCGSTPTVSRRRRGGPARARCAATSRPACRCRAPRPCVALRIPLAPSLSIWARQFGAFSRSQTDRCVPRTQNFELR